ncbi:UNVERIFIED_CONTAM: hypothetical protein PYX00_007723 [Menopon gallinae]|uniref:Uncharacterized protein n=1 Tax=Menopon gallinae TaxID=328185 RepID=A0AAW2HKE1_9NEOP
MTEKQQAVEPLAATKKKGSQQSFASLSEADLGSMSNISSFEGSTGGYTGEEFVWRNQYQHALYFLTYSYSWGLFSSHRRGSGIAGDSEIPSWIHILIVYIVFAGPLLYLETFVGQYTHRGCVAIGEMVPLAYGVGYVVVAQTFLTCSLNLFFCSNILYYILVSMLNYPTPAWMICLDDYITNLECFSRDDIDACDDMMKRNPTQPCFNPDTQILSGTLFKEQIIFASGVMNKTQEDFRPNTTKTINLLLATAIVIILTVRNIRDIDDSIKISVIFCIVTIIVTISVIFLNNLRLNMLATMFSVNPASLVNLKCWKLALVTTVMRISLLEGGHFLFGSYMPHSVNSVYRVFYLITSHIVVLFLSSVLVFLMEDYFCAFMNVDVEVLNRYTDIDSTFVIYPTVLGTLAAAQLWTTLYFSILFALALHGIALQIIVIQETVSQVLISRNYYAYTRLVIIFLLVIICVIFTSNSGAQLAVEIYLSRSLIFMPVAILLYIVLLVYGFDRFSDDIEFILHSPPPIYLKAAWFLSLVILFLLCFVQEGRGMKFPKTTTTVLCLLFLPMPIGFIYQSIRAIRKKALMIMVKGDNFGPQDPDEKANRLLFNPRYEVRFRRRHSYCKHRCLLESYALRRCLEKELIHLTRVLMDIEENEEERMIRKKLRQALRIHRVIMIQALHFNPALEYFHNPENDYNYLVQKKEE